MDTRRKIIAADEAVALAAGATVVSGWFDPVLADHARRLGEIAANGRPVLVVVTTPPDPLPPAQARAELVASLEAVDYVVVGENGLLERFPSGAVVREEAADARRREALTALVRSRHPEAQG